MTVLDSVRANRQAAFDARGSLLTIAASEKRGLHASEQRQHDKLTGDLAVFDERITELEDNERRDALAGQVRRETGGAQVGTLNGGVYRRGDAYGPSFFKDLIHSQRGDFNAIDRLARNNRETGLESRALGNTGATGGSGGEFAPPAWLIEDFVKLARPGRVFANLLHSQNLPSGVATINLPKVATGTTAAVQTTQNTALSQIDITTNFLSSGITVIGGKEIVSQQLLDQSGIPFDQVILGDLAADYARALDVQTLIGTGTAQQLRGYLTAGASSPNILTWTQATPTASGFYSQLSKLQGMINATRYMPADTVVLHPRRWAWLAGYQDSTGRPLVAPTGMAYNGLAIPDNDLEAQGAVGTILGMTVFTDANIPTTLGAGTNQDVALMFRRDDLWLWESDLRAEAFTQTYADSLGVLFRCYAYSALIPDRYLASLGQLTGTGMVAPVFQS